MLAEPDETQVRVEIETIDGIVHDPDFIVVDTKDSEFERWLFSTARKKTKLRVSRSGPIRVNRRGMPLTGFNRRGLLKDADVRFVRLH